jgi:cytochrome c5
MPCLHSLASRWAFQVTPGGRFFARKSQPQSSCQALNLCISLKSGYLPFWPLFTVTEGRFGVSAAGFSGIVRRFQNRHAKRGFKVSESGKIQSGVRGTIVMALTMITLLVSGFSMAAREDDIRERLQPAGTVCVMGNSCAAGMAVAGSGDSGPKDPQQVYQTYCFACHGTGANNSPVLGNAEQWNPRIEKGLDALYESAVNGFNNNAMPAKGLCMDCSAEDIHATVDYMLDQL